MRVYILYFLLTFLPIVANGQVLPTHPATALNKVILYPDSSFFDHSSTFYEEGDLFEIIGESRYEHEDAAQNQKFKWYQVKTSDNKKGWIFGDGIAVIVPKEDVVASLRKYHLTQFSYTGGEDQLTAWVATIQGRDNLHAEDYLNPIYIEQYLVLTSPLKKSVHIQLSGRSAMGSNELKQLRFTDINGDGVSEVILVRSSTDNGSPLESRTIEIYAFQAGSIVKIFEERMTLTYQGNEPSPALFKVIDIGDKTIRVAYVDYLNCDNYSLTLETNEVSKTQERCMEYVTYTYAWNAAQQKYYLLYDESRTYLTGTLQEPNGYALRREPSFLGEVVEKIPHDTPLTIIKHYEKVIKRRDQKVVVPYLYVQTPAGNYGYLHADKVQFGKTEQAAILQQFYKNPPLLKADWTSSEPFLFLKKDLEEIIVTGNE